MIENGDLITIDADTLDLNVALSVKKSLLKERKMEK
jgi:dihydroxyacid dehydratase/phosphogluconate dehydratase